MTAQIEINQRAEIRLVERGGERDGGKQSLSSEDWRWPSTIEPISACRNYQSQLSDQRINLRTNTAFNNNRQEKRT